MSEARALVLLASFPQRAALVRRSGAAIFPIVGRLEAKGYVTQHRGGWRLTRRGATELALGRALARAVARAA
jgi:hypothetical protein